jgi:hypothetical protein
MLNNIFRRMEPMKRGNAECYLSLAILIIVELAVMLPLQPKPQPKPIGGKLYAPDFEDGFRLYVEEGYCIYYNPRRSEPHSIWMVNDMSIKDDIYSLCGAMKSIRQWDPAHTLAGTPSFFWVLPHIYFVTETYGYSISVVDWRNYRAHTSTRHFYGEFLGQPVLFVFCVDLTQKADDEDALDYIRSLYFQDSLNRSVAGRSWISMMPLESLDGLLSVLNSVDDTVAEVYAEE